MPCNSRHTDPFGQSVSRVVCLWLVLLLLPLGALADSESDKEAAKLKQVQKQIAELKNVLSTMRGRYDNERKALRKTERDIGRIAGKIRELKQDIDAQNRQLGELKKEQGQLQSRLADDRRRLAAQVRAQYFSGRQEQIKLLLHQDDPTTVQRVLLYYDYLNRSRGERIKRVRADLERLATVENAIAQRKQRLQHLYDAEQAQAVELRRVRKERNQIVASLKQDIQNKDKHLKQLQEDEKHLQQVLATLESMLADLPDGMLDRKPFSSLKGKHPWPTRGRLVASYNSTRHDGRLRWKGVLIGAQTGTDVRAISHGRVAFADWLRGYGMLIILDHGDGYMTLYGHNQSIYKEMGEWVEAGEVIASVGDSGGSQRSALYFEIRRQGKPVNPASWCRPIRGKSVDFARR